MPPWLDFPNCSLSFINGIRGTERGTFCIWRAWITTMLRATLSYSQETDILHGRKWGKLHKQRPLLQRVWNFVCCCQIGMLECAVNFLLFHKVCVWRGSCFFNAYDVLPCSVTVILSWPSLVYNLFLNRNDACFTILFFPLVMRIRNLRVLLCFFPVGCFNLSLLILLIYKASACYL